MTDGGINRKWSALNDERDALRTERDDLQREVARLLAERDGTANLEKYGLGFDPDEQEVANALQFVYEAIMERWGLLANQFEFVGAMHVIQSFIIQRMLGRLSPDQWSGWYAQPEEKERDAESPQDSRNPV